MLSVKFRSADVLKRHSWSEAEQTLMFNAFFHQDC